METHFTTHAESRTDAVQILITDPIEATGVVTDAAAEYDLDALAFAYSIGIELLPWQRWILVHALEILPSGRYRALLTYHPSSRTYKHAPKCKGAPVTQEPAPVARRGASNWSKREDSTWIDKL